jgi:hypothetical protein
MVQRWFTDEFAVEEQVHDDTTGQSKNTGDDLDISDAIEVIRWYQFFVAAKLFRALMGREDSDFDEAPAADDSLTNSDLDEDNRQFDGGDNDDSDGSAKIALIAIDRSSSAWRVMHSCLPEKADSIKAMLLELERMRRGAEQNFPNARDFIRPGFDEVDSKFMN